MGTRVDPQSANHPNSLYPTNSYTVHLMKCWCAGGLDPIRFPLVFFVVSP